MKANVLIVTYSMIPHASTWGGCQRMYYLAEQLISDGYNVTVASCKTSTYDHWDKTIHFKTMPLEVTNKLARSFLSGKSGQRQAAIPQFQSKGILSRLKKCIKSSRALMKLLAWGDRLIYNEPGVLSGFISNQWCKENSRVLISFIRENQIRSVIVSAPPFGMFRIVEEIKKNCPGITVIADYRDPWNLWKKGSFLTRRKEQKLLAAADFVTCTNEYIADALSETNGVPRQKFHIVGNGYNEADFSDLDAVPADTDRFVITYTGAISLQQPGYRDISNLLRTIKRLTDEGKQILLKLVGITLSQGSQEIFWQEQLGDHLQLIPPISNKEAIQHVQTADIALLVHTSEDASGKYIISGKLYDYLRCRIPMLSIGRFDSAHARVISSLGIGINCENEEQSIYRTVSDLYAAWERRSLNTTYSYSKLKDIQQYSRIFQNQQMESLLQ